MKFFNFFSMKANKKGRFIERITKELENLLSTLDGNEDKVKDIIHTFIFQSPRIFEQIESCITNNNLKEAAFLIHKIKTHYGYLGLDEISADFTAWENELLLPTQTKNHIPVLNALKQINEEVMNELKETNFYQAEPQARETPLPLEGKSVLIAEDDEVNAMVFELFVKETGADTMIARDGLQALQMAIEKKPDMIFMDVHMPFYSGLQTIKELRDKDIQCPIISLSASTRLNERQNSLDAGANDFLVKPANRESINKVLLKYLE